MPIAPRPEPVVICGGARVSCPLPVILWGESGLSFQERPRRKATRVVCLHWTGGEGDAAKVHHVLTTRKTSVQFFIDAAGVIWQFCDADRECVHAPGWNKTGIGIELQNRGSDLTVKLPKGLSRSIVRERIHGRMLSYSDFTPLQVVSAVTLVRVLCGAFKLPVQVPVDDAGKVITRGLLPDQMARFSGVCGHYQSFGSNRDDPGPRLLRLIHDQEMQEHDRS